MHVAVVGAGLIGLLTAVRCVEAGHRVTVVEQDTIPSPRATSFDRHRILRALHPGDGAATVEAARARRLWIELQGLLSSRFVVPVGALTVLPAGAGDRAGGGLALLHRAGERAEAVDRGRLARDWPHLSFRHLAGDADRAAAPAVLEPDAGVLLADRALAACVGWLRWRPEATLLAHRRAERVDPAGPAVHLADGEVVRADALVVAAGPWSRRLVGRRHTRDLILYRQSVLYCRVPDPDLERWAETPAVPALGTREGAWLVPPVAGTPLKVSAASACRAVGDVGDRRTEDRWVEHVGTICTGIIPGFDDGWITDARDCYYLASPRPRGRAVVALGERAVAVAACGGGAAKTAPVIADALVRRVTRPAGVSRTGAATRASRGTPLSRTSSP